MTCVETVRVLVQCQVGVQSWDKVSLRVDHLHFGAPARVVVVRRRRRLCTRKSKSPMPKHDQHIKSHRVENRLVLPSPFALSHPICSFICALSRLATIDSPPVRLLSSFAGERFKIRCCPPRDRGRRSIRTMRFGRRTMMPRRHDCEWWCRSIHTLLLFCVTRLERLSSFSRASVGLLSSFCRTLIVFAPVSRH